MIIQGKVRGGGAQLGRYLEGRDAANAHENDRVTVLENPAGFTGDLEQALTELQRVTRADQREKAFYFASINPDPHEPRLSYEQAVRAADILGQKLNLEDQPRAIVEHVKPDGRQHFHVVWWRYDPQRDVMIDRKNNFRAHEKAAEQCMREFGHAREIPRAHERDKERTPRPDARAPDWEYHQAAERGYGLNRVAADMAAARATSDSGRAFQAALADRGYVLARGDRRAFVAIDPAGGVRSIGRLLRDASSAERAELFKDVRIEDLPDVRTARADLAERRVARVRAAATHAFENARDAADFQSRLAQDGYVLARGDRRAFVIVDGFGQTHSLARRLEGIDAKRLQAFLAPIAGELPSLDDARGLQNARAVALDRQLEAFAPVPSSAPRGIEESRSAASERAPEDDRAGAAPDRAQTGLAGGLAGMAEAGITALADFMAPSAPPTREEIAARHEAQAAAAARGVEQAERHQAIRDQAAAARAVEAEEAKARDDAERKKRTPDRWRGRD